MIKLVPTIALNRVNTLARMISQRLRLVASGTRLARPLLIRVATSPRDRPAAAGPVTRRWNISGPWRRCAAITS